MTCACGQNAHTTHACPALAGPICRCGQPAWQSHVCPAVDRVFAQPQDMTGLAAMIRTWPRAPGVDAVGGGLT